MSASAHETGRRGRPAALGPDGWSGLAAAPTFAAMAILNCLPNMGADMSCPAASPLSSMGLMYALMCAFHSAPWLKLILPR